MGTPAAEIRAAAARACAITDPAERAIAVGDILTAFTELSPELRADRQAAVTELRNQHMSLGEIAKVLGLSRSRIQQIAEGRTAGKRAAPEPAAVDTE